MTILDKIIKYKRSEVEEAKKRVSVQELMYYRHFDKKVPSLKEYLLNPNKTELLLSTNVALRQSALLTTR